MGWLRKGLRGLARVPGVPKARRLAELSVTPNVRSEVHQLGLRVDELDRHLPAVLNAIASANGTARLLARRLNEVENTFRLARGVEPKILNGARLSHSEIRLNLGAGSLTIDGFVNVDVRELPGIDIVAPLDHLPFDAATVTEILCSHSLQQFPEQQLRRRVLPYWIGLLKVGGTFRAVVPDLEAMTSAFCSGALEFEVLRSVTFGTQENEGDFHFTGFTPDSMARLLTECGLQQPTIIARARPHGDLLELEVSAIKLTD